MSFSVGDKVGPYQIVARLGQGGMASVYRAYHEALDRYVAIKVLHPAFVTDASFLRRFQREARVVAQLDHPHIVPVYDFAEHEGYPYLVMRLIEGQTLKDLLQKRRLSRAEIPPLVTAIASALDYAHTRGVLHRDIKPSNIILSGAGKVTITDFGLARLAETSESTLSQDMMLGTPQYISPEQARGEREIDERADVYSFGVILFELVCGRVPFQADTAYAIVHDHIFTPPPAANEINTQAPPALAAVLDKALAKDPAARYPSAGALAAAFRQALLTMPAEAFPPDRPHADGSSRDAGSAQPDNTPTAASLPAASPHPPAAAPSRRRTVTLVLVGMALGMCLCLGLLALGNSLEQRQQAGTATALSAATQAARPALSPWQVPPPEQVRSAAELLPLVEAAPDNLSLRLELTIAHLQAGETDAAQQLIASTFARAENPAVAINAVEAVLVYPAYYDLAQLLLQSGIQQFPDNPMLYHLMMMDIILADRGAAAAADLAARIPGRPGMAFTVQLGEAYQAYTSGNLAAAMRILNTSLRDPNNTARASFLFLQGYLYQEMGEPQRALMALQAALAEEDVPVWLQTHIRRLLAAASQPAPLGHKDFNHKLHESSRIF